MAEVVEESLRADPQAPAQARSLIKKIALDSDAQARIALIVSELVTNAVVHGQSDRPDEVLLRVELEDERVRGEVCGSGPAFAWTRTEPDLSEPGGLGLLVVDEIADDWGVGTNSHVCVWFECRGCAAA